MLRPVYPTQVETVPVVLSREGKKAREKGKKVIVKISNRTIGIVKVKISQAHTSYIHMYIHMYIHTTRYIYVGT